MIYYLSARRHHHSAAGHRRAAKRIAVRVVVVKFVEIRWGEPMFLQQHDVWSVVGDYILQSWATLAEAVHIERGRLKTRDLTSRDHRNCGSLHRETGQLGTIS